MDEQSASDRAAVWSELAAGPATTASLTALTDLDPATLGGADTVDAIVCTEKAASLILGIQAQLMARLATPFVAGDPMRLAAKLARRSGLAGGDDYDCNVQAMVDEAAQSMAASEISAALRIAPVTAGIRVREARHLTEDFTPARHALEEGRIDRGKLRAIVDRVQVLPAEHVGPVLDRVLPECVDRSTSEIREITDQAVIAADPCGAADRHREAAARRDVSVTPSTDAMATLKAFLPADGAVKIFQVSDLLATSTAGITTDARGIGARRADALIDIADQLLTNGRIDLTGYLGPLPDHGALTQRPARRSATDGSTGCVTTGTPAEPNPHDVTHELGARAGDPDPSTAGPTTSGAAPAISADSDSAISDAEGGNRPRVDARPDDAEGRGDHDDDVQADDDDSDPAGSAIASQSAGSSESCTVNPTTSATIDSSELPVTEPVASSAAGRAAAPTDRLLTRQGRRPHLTVTMSLDTLAGLNDLPAVLAGLGSIPADMARTIAASAGTITAAISDPATGAVIDCGDLTYRPRQALRDKVGVLTDTCQFPSCRQPAWRCDVDHRDPFDRQDPTRGGPTTAGNTGGLCRRHHLLKTHAGWQLSVDTQRLIINWTSPTGHTYSRRRRQSSPPRAWIRTGGTAIADRLDEIAAMRGLDIAPTPAANTAKILSRTGPDSAGTDLTDGCPETSSHGTSAIEDGLTDALLRHSLAHPTDIHYDAPERTVSGDDLEPGQNDGDEIADDPPPF